MQEKDIYWLSNNLPPFKEIELRGEPDFYGISHIIAAQIKRKLPPKSFATWTHGWLFPEKIISLSQLIWCDGIFKTHLVANQSQVESLKSFGITNAEAVGLPFIYLDKSKVTRKENSLLVMPPHSLPYTEPQWDQNTYAEEIVKLKADFPIIVVCVHSSCVQKGYWVKEFENAGIPCITGASINDENALLRMQTIFSSFDYMTTNTLGSHIAYASYCGCKVSLFGTYQPFTRKDAEHDPYYIKNPELVDLWIQLTEESYIREKLPHLFVHPKKAVPMIDWAGEMLGLRYKKSPTHLAKLLGWSYIDKLDYYYKFLINYLERPNVTQRVLKGIAKKLKRKE
jgi:hypothetical protein